jgi:hypothetical protein
VRWFDSTSIWLGGSIWRPIQGAALWVVVPGLKPGLKPWAESSGPFGAQISGRELLAEDYEIRKNLSQT